MADEFDESPEDFHLFELDEYIEVVVDYLENLRPDIVVERFASQSPKELLIAPDWGLKNYELVEKIKRRMRERDTWQGKNYSATL
jgi:radical SAM superfamily enzyme